MFTPEFQGEDLRQIRLRNPRSRTDAGPEPLADGNPDLALSAGLLLYLTQVLVLFGLIIVLRDATWLDGRVFGMAVLAVTLAWIVGSIIASQRVKILYVDPSLSKDAAVETPPAGEPS